MVDSTSKPPNVLDWGALVSCGGHKSGGSKNEGYLTLKCTKCTVDVEVAGLQVQLCSPVLKKELNPTTLNTNLSCSSKCHFIPESFDHAQLVCMVVLFQNNVSMQDGSQRRSRPCRPGHHPNCLRQAPHVTRRNDRGRPLSHKQCPQ